MYFKIMPLYACPKWQHPRGRNLLRGILFLRDMSCTIYEKKEGYRTKRVDENRSTAR